MHIGAAMIQRVSGNLQISFEQSGDTGAPVLVLLHAFPLSSAMWQKQLDFFGGRFRVLTPDARGVGDTSPFAASPSIETMARDLADLLDFLEIETAILGGCSMGGYTALEFVRQFPRRLRGFILCDTRADPDSDEARRAREEMIAFARQNDGSAVAEKMLPKLLCGEACHHRPEIVERVRDLAKLLSGQSAAQLVQALRDRRDSTPVLPSIRVPTLVIGGRDDVPAPLAVMAEMAARIPDSKHVVIEDAGHLSSLEQSDVWNREVEAWLNESGL